MRCFRSARAASTKSWVATVGVSSRTQAHDAGDTGCGASSAWQAASIAAWNDEAHVRENRRLYAEKFSAVLPLIQGHLKTERPEGGFYLWIRTPIDDAEFARGLQRDYNVLVLPGSFLARDAHAKAPALRVFRECCQATIALRCGYSIFGERLRG